MSRGTELVNALFWSLSLVVSLSIGAEAQEVPVTMPTLDELSVLPRESDPHVDRLLDALEEAYASMDVDRWVSCFTEDVEQIDVPRRVHVVGREAWRTQTERINAGHRRMGRVHHGRAVLGNWIVVEVEWTGTVRGEVIGRPGEDRRYRYSGLALLELAGERIRRQIIYGDVATLNQQLGIE